jgi:hypothetical protein
MDAQTPGEARQALATRAAREVVVGHVVSSQELVRVAPQALLGYAHADARSTRAARLGLIVDVIV